MRERKKERDRQAEREIRERWRHDVNILRQLVVKCIAYIEDGFRNYWSLLLDISISCIDVSGTAWGTERLGSNRCLSVVYISQYQDSL